MSAWRFHITENAERDVARLDAPIRKRIKERLLWFQDHFEEVIPLPLGGSLTGFFKLRAGDWRIVYGIENDKSLVTIHAIDHRDKIYKRKFI